jgi:hypothetical protein
LHPNAASGEAALEEVAASEEAASAEGGEVSVVDGEVAVSSDELIRRSK